MQLTVLNTGSKGNGYVLQDDTTALVLECGVPRQDCLAALNWSTAKVAGCLLTHEHGDHARYVQDYLQLMNVYTSQGTAEAVMKGTAYGIIRKPTALKPLKTVRIGAFFVRPIPAQHDAAEPYAYIIEHPNLGRLLFATDTYYIKYRIPNLNHMLIECNYSRPILDINTEEGIIPPALRQRTLSSHMSLEHLKEMLAANDLTKLSQIILIHLSARNSDKNAFCREIIKQTGKYTIAASKGLQIELSAAAPF